MNCAKCRSRSALKEELELSDVNSVDSQLSSSVEYEIEQESDGPSADMSTSEEHAAAFAEEPRANAEWTAEYERKRKADEEMKALRDRLEDSVAAEL